LVPKGKLVGTPYHDLLLDEKQFNVVQQMQQQMQQMQMQLEQVSAAYEQMVQQGTPPLEEIIAQMPQLIEGRAKQVAGQMLQPHSPDGPKGGSNVQTNPNQPSGG
jgi:TolA-binding protein